ncbi:hypothetical protein GCM10020218_103400 [Dactylosporangium vinaceum]
MHSPAARDTEVRLTAMAPLMTSPAATDVCELGAVPLAELDQLMAMSPHRFWTINETIRVRITFWCDGIR